MSLHVAEVLWSTLALLATAVASLFFAGHSVHVTSVGIFPPSMYGISYAHKDRLAISFSSIHLRFHLPRSSNPRWAMLTALGYEYRDLKCHVTLAKVEATLWIIPVHFKVTSGSLISVELADFRLRVFSTQYTPGWVERLRKNLVSTILTGEVIRLDDFKTQFFISPTTGAENGTNGEIEHPGILSKDNFDEIRATALCSQYHVRNWQARMYTFGRVEAQLRRNWIGDRGTYVMVAEEGRWIKVHELEQRQQLTLVSPWRSFLRSIAAFPFDMYRIYKDPIIRDAELLRQTATLLMQKLNYEGIHIDLPAMFFDAIAGFIFS